MVCGNESEDEQLQMHLRSLVKRRCEVESDQDITCNDLLEQYVNGFNENNFDQCYDMVIQIRNAASYTGYRLASKDITNILSI